MDNIAEFINKKLKQSSSFKYDYKFAISNNNSYCDNSITIDTPVEKALKKDKNCELIKTLFIFIKKSELQPIIKDEIINESINYNIYIIVNAVSNEDFIKYNVDSNQYIYDYFVSNEISSGINDNYVFIPSKNIYIK